MTAAIAIQSEKTIERSHGIQTVMMGCTSPMCCFASERGSRSSSPPPTSSTLSPRSIRSVMFSTSRRASASFCRSSRLLTRPTVAPFSTAQALLPWRFACDSPHSSLVSCLVPAALARLLQARGALLSPA